MHTSSLSKRLASWATLWVLSSLPPFLVCSHAADPGKMECKSTQECDQQLEKMGATRQTKVSEDSVTSARDANEDQFYLINEVNKASLVMLTEEGVVSKPIAKKIAQGVASMGEQANQATGKRPADYLQIERMLTDRVGSDGSLIHSGRSRQDIYATIRAIKLRNQLMDFHDALNTLRASLIVLAEKNVQTIVPAYTNGVQAMPDSYAHYLLGFINALERDAKKIHDAYPRLNSSPMGTAVLANSSWPINRERLSYLLGFDQLVVNSFDSSQIIPIDNTLEAVGIVNTTALHLGMMLQDLHTQYHQTRPWLLLDEASTYTSSSMPQKRNPGLIMRARESASAQLGLGVAILFRDHNVSSGMTDYKQPTVELNYFPQAMGMLKSTNAVIKVLKVNPSRSLEEVEDDWTTSMELAEGLQSDFKIPFRMGHSFASAIVDYAREKNIKPKDFPYLQAQLIYTSVSDKMNFEIKKLPISEKRFKELLSPTFMVKTRLSTGGPQESEVQKMLQSAKTALSEDQSWLSGKRQTIDRRQVELNRLFEQL
jgi:argininosuccinate lyase